MDVFVCMQHTGDARNPYAILRASYRGMNNWIRRNNNPCIEKPNSLQPVESAAILHNLSIACVEALQGGGLFELKDFQVRSVPPPSERLHPRWTVYLGTVAQSLGKPTERERVHTCRGRVCRLSGSCVATASNWSAKGRT